MPSFPLPGKAFSRGRMQQIANDHPAGAAMTILLAS
jgi:hypothetical protein